MPIKTEYILFGVLGIIVLYALSRVRRPEVQQVPEFISSGYAPQSGGVEATQAARLSAFQSLASLGASQTEAELGRYTMGAQLEATGIASRVQEALGLGEFASRERMQAAELSYRREALPQELEVSRYGIGTEFEKFVAGLRSQETLYQADLSNRLAQMAQQISAVQGVGQTYRGQSLERQGTILNALGQIWGGGQPYDYVSAFGRQRPPGFFEQLFQTVGNVFGGGRGGAMLGFPGVPRWPGSPGWPQ